MTMDTKQVIFLKIFISKLYRAHYSTTFEEVGDTLKITEKYHSVCNLESICEKFTFEENNSIVLVREALDYMREGIEGVNRSDFTRDLLIVLLMIKFTPDSPWLKFVRRLIDSDKEDISYTGDTLPVKERYLIYLDLITLLANRSVPHSTLLETLSILAMETPSLVDSHWAGIDKKELQLELTKELLDDLLC